METRPNVVGVDGLKIEAENLFEILRYTYELYSVDGDNITLLNKLECGPESKVILYQGVEFPRQFIIRYTFIDADYPVDRHSINWYALEMSRARYKAANVIAVRCSYPGFPEKMTDVIWLHLKANAPELLPKAI